MKRKTDDMPESVRGDEMVAAFYDVVLQGLEKSAPKQADLQELAVETAFAIEHIVTTHELVHWQNNDLLNGLDDDIEDYLFCAIGDPEGVVLTPEVVDMMVMRILLIARYELAE